MAAPLGNSFWMKRSKHGPNVLYDDAKILLQECCEYFKHCDDNPWIKYEAIRSGDNAGKLIPIPTQNPYTLAGLCLYLDIDQSTWCEWRKKRNDLSKVIHMCDEIIYDNKFKGAAVGAFNPNIIARDLGLRDDQNINQNTTIVITDNTEQGLP